MTTTVAITESAVSGRAWAYTGVILGGLVSIAANVAHSLIPPPGSPAGWTVEPGAVVSAMVWPVFLFIAVEILARTAWPAGRIWHVVRWAGLVPVAVVAALVSYRHLSGLLAHYGEEPMVYYLGPLAVDGLMVMATGALLATGRHTRTHTAPVPAHAGRPDVVSTVTPEPTPVSALSTVDTAVPSLADAASAPSTPDPDRPSSIVDTEPEPVPATVSTAPVPSPAEVAPRITRTRPTNTPTSSTPVSRPARRAPRPRPNTPTEPPATLAPSTTDTPVSASDAAQPTLPVPAELLARATHTARQYRTEHGTPITPGQLAVRLKVTSEQAAQALAVIGLNPNQTTNPTVPTPTVNGRQPKATR